MYDLNTKAQFAVYCLGGPDVEKWKCDEAQSISKGRDKNLIAKTLPFCCKDVFRGDRDGMSEIIHFRHLLHGKIPLSMYRFPVYLERYRNGNCVHECFRLHTYRYKDHLYRINGTLYPFMMPTFPGDPLGRGISARDQVLCNLVSVFKDVWNPLSAAQLSLLNGSSATVDFNRSLNSQDRLHPSILLHPKNAEIWRIHPSWNTDGCLSFLFQNNNHSWRACTDHSAHDAVRYSADQLFWLHVKPHQESPFDQYTDFKSNNVTPVSAIHPGRVTRIATANVFKAACMTVSSMNVGARVAFQDCTINQDNPAQLFETIEGIYSGSIARTTIGYIRLAADPSMCVFREEDVSLTNKQTAGGASLIPRGSALTLGRCIMGGSYHRLLFEFELVLS
jgi:hypothetical protein